MSLISKRTTFAACLAIGAALAFLSPRRTPIGTNGKAEGARNTRDGVGPGHTARATSAGGRVGIIAGGGDPRRAGRAGGATGVPRPIIGAAKGITARR